MYESPITINTTMQDIVRTVNEQAEDFIVKSVIKMGVDVNKDELIKAMKYDRDQYVKGYNDGKKETAQEIFKKAFAILTKCVAEDGFYATESDSDISINGNVVWFELEKLANEFGIELE